MADIRINSLPTTASASSSDDFLALDGATNGTRKLNAFSPTFGGNATVGGTLTVSGTGLSSVLGSLSVAGQVISPANSTLVMDFVSGADQGRLLAKNSAGTYTNPILVVNPLTTSGNLTASGTLHTFGASNKAVIQMSAGTGALPAGGWIYGSDEGLGFSPNGTGLNKKLVMAYFDGSAYRSALEFENVSSGTATLKLSDYGGPTTVGGNLTVSGTGNNIFNSGGGNLLIGGVIDGGQKLQVNGTASFADAVTVGGTLTVNSNRIQVGKSGSGTGGNLRCVSDDGNTRWLVGLLGAAGATNFSIYDLVNSREPLAISAAGNTTIAGDLTVSSSGTSTFAGSVKTATRVYAEKSGAGILGQSVGLIEQSTTVDNTTYSVTTNSAKVFVVQLSSGDAALCYTSYKSSTITILGSDGTIVNSSSPSSTQLGIYKSANAHVISFKTGSNAAAGGFGSWGFCFLGNPVTAIA